MPVGKRVGFTHPGEKSPMPALEDVMGVIEDDEALDLRSSDEADARASRHPREDCNPSCASVSVGVTL